MQIFCEILSYLLPIFYFGLIYVYYQIFTGRNRKFERWTKNLLLILLFIHGSEIVLRQIYLKTMPLSSTYDAISFLAFSILLVYYIIERSFNNKASGFFIMLFAFFPALIAAFNHHWRAEKNPLLATPTFAIHASLNIIGYTALTIGAIYAVMFLIQYKNMKQRRFNRFYEQLPPVTYLENMSKRAVLIGIILMGVGIFLGHVQTKQMFGHFFISDPKVIFTDLIWVLYVAVYVGAKVKRWSSRTMAYFNVLGFSLLSAGGAIVFLMIKSFHKFY